MKYYKGSTDDDLKPLNGGEYNKEKIGHEVYNYLNYNDEYYGYVQSSSIHIERMGASITDSFIDDVLVVWVSKRSTGGQYVIGWYKNATVYRTMQKVPDEAMNDRKLKNYNKYNVYSKNVTLVTPGERTKRISGIGQQNIWYGDEKTNAEVLTYISDYENRYMQRIIKIEEGLDKITGKEREAIIKARVNQDRFRSGLLAKYSKCCLCGVNDKELLIASHIKPWRDSNENEKLDYNNGLILCPGHDKLFDNGYISFDDSGHILISSKLSLVNRTFMNVNDNMIITVNEDNVEYLRYHRENVFKDK